jgi:hypothetical protein
MHVETEERYISRDTKSMALLNTNKQALDNYKKQKQRVLDSMEINTKVETLEKKVDNIEALLGKILEKLDG